MILQEHKKEGARKKVGYKNYLLGTRIRELEQSFFAAKKENDHWHMQFYDREIAKIYKRAGIVET